LLAVVSRDSRAAPSDGTQDGQALVVSAIAMFEPDPAGRSRLETLAAGGFSVPAINLREVSQPIDQPVGLRLRDAAALQ
jgi:hypothetical protein